MFFVVAAALAGAAVSAARGLIPESPADRLANLKAREELKQIEERRSQLDRHGEASRLARRRPRTRPAEKGGIQTIHHADGTMTVNIL